MQSGLLSQRTQGDAAARTVFTDSTSPELVGTYDALTRHFAQAVFVEVTVFFGHENTVVIAVVVSVTDVVSRIWGTVGVELVKVVDVHFEHVVIVLVVYTTTGSWESTAAAFVQLRKNEMVI